MKSSTNWRSFRCFEGDPGSGRHGGHVGTALQGIEALAIAAVRSLAGKGSEPDSGVGLSQPIGQDARHAEPQKPPVPACAAQAKLHYIPFHCLRDTFATLLLMANVPLTYISEQLGHKDPSVTVEHYARWLPGSNREAMDVLPGPDVESAKERVEARQLEDTNRPQ